MPEVLSDSDLPKLLNTSTKQVKWAKKLVLEHLGSASKRVENTPIQGMFSKTLFLTLVDGREVVIQFRTEPLDLEVFRVAKDTLGPFVPDSIALPDEELRSQDVWAYSFDRMPGKPWLLGVAGKGADGRIAICKSLGSVFSTGLMAQSSAEAVAKIRFHVGAILASPLKDIVPYRGIFQRFNNDLDGLADLPLWVVHYDLNETNVMVNENCKVTALIDWSCLAPCLLELDLVAFTP